MHIGFVNIHSSHSWPDGRKFFFAFIEYLTPLLKIAPTILCLPNSRNLYVF